MNWLATITVRFDSEHDELDLLQDIETAVWEAMTSLSQADRIGSASHVDVEVEEEDE